MARSSQSSSYLPSCGSIAVQANSPTRTIWRWAFSMSSTSAAQRDSGHCSGYQAAPSSNGGGFTGFWPAAQNGTAARVSAARTVVNLRKTHPTAEQDVTGMEWHYLEQGQSITIAYVMARRAFRLPLRLQR